MGLYRKTLGVAILLLLVVLIAVVENFLSPESLPASGEIRITPQVIIDAGHGGFDGGAVADDGTIEKDINLKISDTLSELLRISGYEVIRTRDSDNSTEDNSEDKISSRKKSDLKNRLEIMKKYPDAVFVSIHLNKFTTSSAKGSQVFYSPKTEDSDVLGENIQSAIIKMLQPENERVIKKGNSSTYLLKNALIPAVIVECGFLSNKSELELLKNEDYQNKMAFSIFCGINNYFYKGDNNVTES